MTKANAIAVGMMRHLVDCPDHGYSQYVRWGADGIHSVVIDNAKYYTARGDRDCSSAVVDCWRTAIKGTPYAGSLDAATFTGNMRSVFTASGLFEWKPATYAAKPGDIYLNEAHHTAMCMGDGMLAEFSSSENGGIHGMQGDQTGYESHMAHYYPFPWDGVLHYNGKADTKESDDLIEISIPNGGADVLRLRNPNNGHFMFTSNVAEKATLVSKGWVFEGVAWHSPDTGNVVYRFYNQFNNEHFFTNDFKEAKKLEKDGWTPEGANFASARGGAPVYRLYNPFDDFHIWTESKEERDGLARLGWRKEGVAFYAG